MVKVCGLRAVEDAVQCVAFGATHLGVVLAQDSPRRASLAQARAIREAAHGVEIVLVFRSEEDATIRAACAATGVLRVQVHGADARRLAALRAVGLRPVPVQRVLASATRLPSFDETPSPESPAVLDGGTGGSGTMFDWSLLGERGPRAVFVAGGITPNNLGALLRHRPWGIDVSSGIEARPGRKDPQRLAALFQVLAVSP